MFANGLLSFLLLFVEVFELLKRYLLQSFLFAFFLILFFNIIEHLAFVVEVTFLLPEFALVFLEFFPLQFYLIGESEDVVFVVSVFVLGLLVEIVGAVLEHFYFFLDLLDEVIFFADNIFHDPQ